MSISPCLFEKRCAAVGRASFQGIPVLTVKYKTTSLQGKLWSKTLQLADFQKLPLVPNGFFLTASMLNCVL
jgi:hypothetical protein